MLPARAARGHAPRPCRRAPGAADRPADAGMAANARRRYHRAQSSSASRPCSSTAPPTRTAGSSPTSRSPTSASTCGSRTASSGSRCPSDAGRARRRWPRSSTCTRWRSRTRSKGHQRPKIEEYDDSLFVVLQTLEPEPEVDGRRAAGRRGRRVRRQQLHPVGPAPDAEGLHRRARPLRARAGAPAHRLRLRAVRDHRRDRRPLLPDPRRARVVARGRREPDVRGHVGAGAGSRSSTTSSAG